MKYFFLHILKKHINFALRNGNKCKIYILNVTRKSQHCVNNI